MGHHRKFRKTFVFDGKRYEVEADTEVELGFKLGLKKDALEKGAKRISRNMLVKDWHKEYLETYREGTISDDNYYVLEKMGEKWICSEIGTMQMKSVCGIHCQRILKNMAGLSKKHILRLKSHLFNMFEKALRNNLVLENPAADLNMPAAEDGTHRAITEDERTIFLAACQTYKDGLWGKVMLYLGPRIGETARIRKMDIDVKAKKIFIDGTKNKASKRWVPIPEHFLFEIKAAESALEYPGEYLFKNREGRRLTKSNLRRKWKGLEKAMNIAAGCETDYGELQRITGPEWIADDFTAHCLRHTYCTDLEAAGVPINIAKDYMGHTRIDTTANIYTHRSESAFERGRELINQAHDMDQKMKNLEKMTKAELIALIKKMRVLGAPVGLTG